MAMDQPNSSAGQLKTDEEIARLVQQGNVEIFAELAARYEQKLKRYGKKFLSGDLASVEDAVQESFLKIYRNIKSYDSQRKFSSWVYRIAHNEFINVLKKKEKGALLFFDPDVIFPHPVAKERADKEVEDHLTAQAIEKCLGRMSFKYREVLVLYYLEEKSYEEIADILRIPVSTVGVRLKRGREAAQKICLKLGEIN
jgi:RNA polymerase sigma-70 factor (ECF subfamily)